MYADYPRRALLTAALLCAIAGNASGEDRTFDLVYHESGGLPKASVFSVLQGDVVVVRITSDAPLRIHLHGYDIERDISPNVATSFRFAATATGRFPIEIHFEKNRKHQPLAYIEVRPR
jgi:hypothetical protein